MNDIEIHADDGRFGPRDLSEAEEQLRRETEQEIEDWERYEQDMAELYKRRVKADKLLELCEEWAESGIGNDSIGLLQDIWAILKS